MQKNGYDREGAVRRANSVRSSDKRMLILGRGSQVLGYTGIKKQADKYPINVDSSHCAHILWVGVHPDFRHKGFGLRLVLACDNIALDWERQGICLNCREKIIPFYASNRYTIVGSYIDEEKIRFVMVKDIK